MGRTPKQPKPGPITGWRSGDRVRVIKEYHDIAKPWPITPGVEGQLGTLQRVQDGVEMWSLWVDKDEHIWMYNGQPVLTRPTKYMTGIAHTNAEKIVVNS